MPFSTIEISEMEATLTILESTLKSAVNLLSGDQNAERLAKLHNHGESELPDLKAAELSTRVVNLLGQVEQLLEPSSLILADHFLGLSCCFMHKAGYTC